MTCRRCSDCNGSCCSNDDGLQFSF